MLRTIQITEGNYRKVADSIFFNLCAGVIGIVVFINWSNSGVADEGTRLGCGWALLAIAADSVAVAFGTPQRFCCNEKALMLCRSTVAGSALHICLHVTMGMRFGMDRCFMTKADAVIISCVSVIGSIVGLVGIVLQEKADQLEDGDENAILMDIEGGKGAPAGGYFKMALLGGTAAPADEARTSTHP